MKSPYQNHGYKFIKIMIVSALLIFITGNVNAQYCGASGTYLDEYIDSVKFGTIENSSYWTGYQDFTHLCTDLVAGQSYPISVLNPSQYSGDRCDVWIDWNQDLDFLDSYEYFNLNTNTPFEGIITVPPSAPTGITRMRIRVRYNGIVDPCGDADQNWGEVEDYSVRVVPDYNMNYTSSTCIQFSDPVVRGSVDQSIIKVIVITDGGVNPIDLADFQCYTTGTTNTSDIISAKMYYTGNSNSFNTSNKFGNPAINPSGYFTFMGNQTLVHDTNYFWLAYDIDPNATIGNFVDAEVTVHTINGTVEYTAVSNPPGAREITGSGILSIDPDSLEVTINACGDSAQYSLVVKNTGTENLNWTCDLMNLQNSFSLHFDGNDDFIDVVASSLPTGNFHYTIEGWIYYESSSYGVVLGWGDHYGNYDEVNILALDDDWIYNYWYDNYMEIETFGHINDWHHITVTYDGTMRYMYLDGKFIGAKYGNSLNVPYNDNFIIGDDGFNSYFTGFMDEVRIWDHALTPEEIWTNMHFPSPLNTSGLINRWSFNEGSGNTTTDMSVNGDVGNINGASWTNFNPYSIFLSGNNNSGVIVPGDSTIINLTFYASDLNSGVYYDTILFLSDDPNNKKVLIPCKMIISGYPLISLSDSCLSYPPVMTGASISESLWIYNTGCDTLVIDTLFTATSSFSTNITSLAIPPGDSGFVDVICTPTLLGTNNDTLYIINNDNDTSICLTGTGTEAPVVATSPAQIDVDFTVCDDSTSHNINIYNQGIYDLYLQVTDPGDPALLIPYPCYPQTTNAGSYNMGIHNVMLNTINNSSSGGGSGFEDYTYISTMLKPGHQYTLSVATGPSYSEDAVAWIDFNNNGNFESGEKIMESFQKTTHTSTFIVPVDGVQNYPLRMRVGSDYYSNPVLTPCMLPRYGQFEDYTVVIRTEWLSVDMITDTLSPGDSTQTTVYFNAAGYPAGVYNSYFYILSNDPVNPGYQVPCNMAITGTAAIGLSSNSLSFDSTLVGGTTLDSVLISNNSCDTLHFNTALANNNFSVISTFNYVLPYDTVPLLIAFNPTSPVTYFDTLLLYNNDKDTTIYLQGSGLPAPQLITEPDSFNIIIQECNGTDTVQLKLKNGGNSELTWESNFMYTGSDYILDFDGSNDHVHIGAMGKRPEKGTIQLWVKPDAIYSYPRLFSTNGISNTAAGISILGNSGGLLRAVFGRDNGAASYFVLSNSFTSNTWYFITIIWDETQNKIWAYMNDQLVLDGVTNTNWCTDFSDVRFGVGYGSDRHWNGKMAEFRMWERILSEKEVLDNMNITLTGYEPGLMGYWNFEQGSGLIAYDRSNHGYDGTLVGGTSWLASDLNLSMPWLSIDTIYGQITPGDSLMANVICNTNTLNAGNYYSEIILLSNDPVNSRITIPVDMQIIGSPGLEFSDTTMIIDTTLVGAITFDTLLITNPGCDTLVIDSISNLYSDIKIYPESDTLMPGESSEFIFEFSPTTVNIFKDTITFYNNYNDTSYYAFATSLPAPLLSYMPDSFNIIMSGCDDTIADNLRLYNYGAAPLNYSILIDQNFYEDFENGLGKWTWTGNWGTEYFYGSHLLTESPGTLYGDNWDIYIEMRSPLVVTQKDNFEISFMIETKIDCNYDDYLICQFNVNGGTYTNYDWYYCNTDTNTITYNLSSYVSNGDLVKFRFNFISDNIYTGDGVRIDDIMVKGVGFYNPWLFVNPQAGSIAVNDSADITVEFTSSGLFSGNYKSNLLIETNDPLNYNDDIPVSMMFDGEASMALSDYCLYYDSAMVGALVEDTLFVSNTGCDTLFINNAITSLADFYISHTSFFIPPGTTYPLIVYFNPTTTGTIYDTLSLNTNANDTLVCLSGIGIPAPSLSYDPSAFNVLFQDCNDSTSLPLTLKNTGSADLEWQLYAVDTNNSALWFDGINDYVQFGTWSPGNKWTLEAWVKPESTPSERKNIVGGLNSCLDWAINMQNGEFGISSKPADGSCSMTLLSGFTAQTGQWYHVAGVYTGNKVYIYVNGIVRDSSDAYNYSGTPSTCRIGGETCCSGNNFPGIIDEVRIWNDARTEAEIISNMNSPLTGNEPNLIGYYDMSQGTATTLYDKSPFAHTGTIYYAIWTKSDIPISEFLSIGSNSGIVAVNDSVVIDINFNALGLTTGNYYNELRLYTNDPLYPFITIPCSMDVIGKPKIALSDSCFDMDSTMVAGFSYDTLSIFNNGCNALIIDSITNIHPEFSINPQPFNWNIPPYQTHEFIISFNPSDLITYFDTLKIFNNDHFVSACLAGTGIVFPVASIQPDSFAVVINDCDDSTQVFLNLYNTGTANLDWTIETADQGIEDNFDPSSNSLNWSSGTGVVSSSCGYHSSPYSLYFNGSGTRFMTTKGLKTFGGGNIEFYLKIGTGSSPCENADAGEDIELSYTVDGGYIWNVINIYSTNSYSNFTYINEAIPAGAISANTYFRWRQLSHSGSGYDNWAMDDIKISLTDYASFPVDSGIVNIGDSSIIAINISSSGLTTGTYSSFVNILTNDPVNPVFNIPYSLTVNGYPLIGMSDSCVSFPPTMIGDISSDTIAIFNTGCDILDISSIYTNTNAYNFSISAMSIDPDGSAELIVNFSPLATGSFYDTLYIINDDVDTLICLNGQAIEAPIMEITPKLIDTSIICFDTVNIPISVINSGPVDLNWQLLLDENTNNMLILDGTNDYVNLGTWNPGAAWTIEVWAKPAWVAPGRRSIAGSVNGCADWAIVMQDSVFGISIRPDDGSCSRFLSSGVKASPGKWYHLAGTNDGNKARIYVNGILKNEMKVDPGYVGTSVYPYIGGSACCANQHFPGAVDEVRIWSYPRTDIELFNFKSMCLNGNEPGLLAYYPLDKGSGTTIYDHTNNNHNGTIYNDAAWTLSDAPVMNFIHTEINSAITPTADTSVVEITLIRNTVESLSRNIKIAVNSNDPLNPSDTIVVNLTYPNNIILPDIGNDTIICLQDTITLDPGPFTSYLWYDGSTNSTLEANTTSSYFVDVVDASGCSFSDTMYLDVSLPLPLADAGGDKNICSGLSVTLDGSSSGGNIPYNYHWKATDGTIIPHQASPIVDPTTNTNYTLYIIDANGCRSMNTDTSTVFVTTSPVINAGSDTTISLGSIITMNASVTSGIPPYTFLWSPPEGLNSTTILNPVSSPLMSTIYNVQIIDSTGCSGYDEVTITIKYSLSGEITYENTSMSPLSNSWVHLYDLVNNYKLDSVYTDSNGNYIFYNLDNGNYHITVSTDKSWGGVNATDALVIRRHIVGLEPISDLPLVASDVNLSNSITSADALQVLRRTIGLSSSFNAGDWVFNEKSIFINNGNRVINLKGLCVGDVNKSYNPSTKKTGMQSISLINDGVINCKANDEILLPVYLNKNLNIGAITLEFDYPGDRIRIIEVLSPAKGIKYNITDNKVFVGWSNTDPVSLSINEPILVFKIILVNESEKMVRFGLGENSELADENAKVIDDLQLKMPNLLSLNDHYEFSLGDNYPNPFNNTTEIPYMIPENGRVSLTIFNLLGEKVKVLFNEIQAKGKYTYDFKRDELSEGIYLYKLEFENNNKFLESTKRMIINR